MGAIGAKEGEATRELCCVRARSTGSIASLGTQRGEALEGKIHQCEDRQRTRMQHVTTRFARSAKHEGAMPWRRDERPFVTKRKWRPRRHARVQVHACSKVKEIDIEGEQAHAKEHRSMGSLGRFRGDLLGRTDPRDRVPTREIGADVRPGTLLSFPGGKGGSRDPCHVDGSSEGGWRRDRTAMAVVPCPMCVFTIQVAALHPTMQTVAGVAPGHAIRSATFG